MNKNHWISILLDGTVSEDKILDLLDMSFCYTMKTGRYRTRETEESEKSCVNPEVPDPRKRGN